MLLTLGARLNSSLGKFLTALFGAEEQSPRRQRTTTIKGHQYLHSSRSVVVEERRSGRMSMNNRYLLDLLEDPLSCPVCLEEYKKVPKILPTCGHSFCLRCIEHWYEYSGANETGILRCPVCKCKTNLRSLKPGNRSCKYSNLSGANDENETSSGRRSSPPSTSSLRGLLFDSPTVEAVLKMRKRSKKESQLENAISTLRHCLTCRACNYRLEEPRMLPACRHSFCTTCLQKLYKPTKDGEVATIECPICSTLYRFTYRSSSPSSSPPPSSKSSPTEEKKTHNSNFPSPPKEKLATYLPFDYVLGCLLDAVPEKM